MYADWPLLSLVVWTPIIGGILVLFAGDKEPSGARKIALIVSIATFLLSLPLYFQFDSSTALMQFVERSSWIPAFNIEYYLGVDGISMPLILLTTFTTIIVIIAAWEVIEYRVSQYLAAFLFSTGCHSVLYLLRSDVDPNVYCHWYLGWSKPHICDAEVFPLHVYRIHPHAGGADLHVLSI